MYMAYNTNPKMPRVRMDAVRLVRSGWSQSKVARHLGYPQGTISKWVKKAPRDGRKNIPTASSRPSRSPKALPQSMVTEHIGAMGIAHRHSRVRQANDNAHIERFNRTIQEECFDRVPKDFSSYRKAAKRYLAYYNGERSHMGINFLTPLKKIAESIPSY